MISFLFIFTTEKTVFLMNFGKTSKCQHFHIHMSQQISWAVDVLKRNSGISLFENFQLNFFLFRVKSEVKKSQMCLTAISNSIEIVFQINANPTVLTFFPYSRLILMLPWTWHKMPFFYLHTWDWNWERKKHLHWNCFDATNIRRCHRECECWTLFNKAFDLSQECVRLMISFGVCS